MTLNDNIVHLVKLEHEGIETLLKELLEKACEGDMSQFVRRVTAQEFPGGSAYFLDGKEMFRVEWYYSGLEVGYEFKYGGAENNDISAHS